MKRAYFGELAARWDSLPGQQEAQARAEEFVRCALPAGCRRVVDAGCGTGVLLPALLKAEPPLELIVALDFAPEMLEQAQRKQAGAPVAWVCGDITQPPLAAGKMDAVLCFNVLPHVLSHPRSLEALVSLLRAGGRLAVGHLMSSARLNEFHAQIGGPVAQDRLPPPEELADSLVALGMEVITAEEQQHGYLVLAERACAVEQVAVGAGERACGVGGGEKSPDEEAGR